MQPLPLARIGHAPEEKTNPARDMLDRVDKWPINFDNNWRWRRFWPHGSRHHHCNRRRRGGLGSLFIHRDESRVKDIGDVELIIGFARRNAIEIRAASRLIERGIHPQRL